MQGRTLHARRNGRLPVHSAAIGFVLFALGTPYAHAADEFDLDRVSADPALHARLPERIVKQGVLVVGSDTSYAPWEYLSEKDGKTPEGIDVDIAEAMTRKLGLRLSFQSAQFDSILPGLGSKYDLGISAFTITAERMQAVTFVSYFRSTNLWVVKAGNPAEFDPHNICGRQIAIQTGSAEETLVKRASEACVEDGKPALDILPFDSEEQSFTRVASGGADAAITGSSTVGYAVKMSEGALATLQPEGSLLDDTLDGIAIAKSDDALAAVVASALNDLIADKTYDQIFQKWGVVGAGIAQATVNPKTP